MSEICFFHSILNAKKSEITSKVKEYFRSTYYNISITPTVSLYAFKREDFKFYWHLRPIELNVEQLDLSSEVLIESQKDKSSTEIRIVFTNHILLEHYFEQLVYQLLDCFSIINGDRMLAPLSQEVKFSSLIEYNKYRFLRDRSAEMVYQLALKQIISSEKLTITGIERTNLVSGFPVGEHERRHSGSKSMFSVKSQLQLVKGWDDLGQIDNRMTLKEYLIEIIGPLSEKDLDKPYITPAVFYSLRRRLIDKGLFVPTSKKQTKKRK